MGVAFIFNQLQVQVKKKPNQSNEKYKKYMIPYGERLANKDIK